MSTQPVSPRILLVEDNARAARRLAQLLGEDGYEVEIAFDGTAALERLGREPRPDALVVDYMLPYVDGMTIANQARRRWPGIPLVIVTSYAEVVRSAAAALAAPTVMLAKPVIYADLVRELASVTGGGVSRPFLADRTGAAGTGSCAR